MGFETVDELTKAVDDARQSKLTHIVGNATCPTLFDPTQAPKGFHTALFENQYTPYDLAEVGAEGWDRVRLDYLERCLNLWRQYAPNINGKNIVKASAYTPLDIERKLSIMVEGSIKHGAYIHTHPDGVLQTKYEMLPVPHTHQEAIRRRRFNLPRGPDNIRTRIQRSKRVSGRSRHKEVVERT
jgi:hypothetical protein